MTQEGSKVENNPAFVRLEAKVDTLTSEIREYKLIVDKNFVSRTEFEVFRAKVLPNQRLVNNVINYIVVAVIGAGVAVLLGDKLPL